MIAKYYGKNFSLQTLRDKCGISREGVSLLGISKAAEAIGFQTLSAKVDFSKLFNEVHLPCIVHWQQNHFVIVHKFQKKRNWSLFKYQTQVLVADPAKGLISYTSEEFMEGWISTKEGAICQGVVLILQPSPKFYLNDGEENTNQIDFTHLFKYLLPYKRLIFQLFLGLLTGSLLQLIFPFLTQSVVDIGINTQNLEFIYLILIAQLMLFIGRTSVDFIRSWILLHISARVNLSILSGFLTKLMRLPLAFFDVKMFGDLKRRIIDHERVQAFITTSSLNTLFSLFNLIVFGIVLAYYHSTIFFIFLGGSLLYAGWVILFLRARRNLDFKRFEIEAKNESGLIQLIQGMQEIKLANSETQKRWEWERIQAKLFLFNVKGLALNQYQQAGAFFFNEGKNIFITFFAAKAVINGQLTLGTMLAVQYIIGQLNSPIEQLIHFLQIAQDAMISLERLNEIHTLEDEDQSSRSDPNQIPVDKDFQITGLNYSYSNLESDLVLKNINLRIPAGKTTAIVGASGSGKTTLLKLLLRFYKPTSGEIRLGENQINIFSQELWREQCGVVMQEGFIFSDTIARNIAVGEEYPDLQKLLNAAKLANIQEFIDALPLKYNTIIGMEGNGISQGQKQRILIARAVYKDPCFIFFDEATNALDANNESIIQRNLERFFLGRTVVVVAHRLSTVRLADQIAVIDKGTIVELGTHDELWCLKGAYFQLIKNQLELSNY
jgi:ATP-binding cassette subfamily B protein